MNMQPDHVRRRSNCSKPGLFSHLQEFFTFLLLLLATTSEATEYFVATNGADTGNNGQSWNQPFLTISNALAQGDVTIVTVSNGTYNISSQILITNAITVRSFANGVYGGRANAAATIVRVSGGSGNRRIFGVTGDAIVDGFTMRDCARTSAMLGGGAYVNSSGAVIQNCIMVNNNGDTLYGGGVYIDSSGGLVQNCTITGNGNSDRVIGGGVYMKAGTVSNCVVSFNKAGQANAGSAQGGGIYASGGTIVSCLILNNDETGGANNPGGGIYSDGSGVVVRNCVIAGNTSLSTGGGVHITGNGGTIENCTIVGNTAGTGGGGGIYRNNGNAGTVRNCIVYSNTSGNATYQNSYSGTATWYYNCTTNPEVAGTGCISGDPLFRDPTEGNYRLSVGSPCIDTGSNLTWTATSVDVDGGARQQDGNNDGTAVVDMGAYEYNTALNCTFVCSPRLLIATPFTYQCMGPAPLTVQFTGLACGTNLTGLGYLWDFDGDGVYDETNAIATATHTYATPGVYTPRLQVTNAASEGATAFKTNYVSAGSTHYVVTNNPNAASPYTSWATAASNNIQAAVNQAALLNGSLVIVSNGTYNISAQIAISTPLAIRSFGNSATGGLANASNTIVRQTAGGSRVMGITANYVDVDGLTIRGARADNNAAGQGYGNGVYLVAASLVRNCVITDNGWADRVFGGGVYMAGGTVSNCVITGNSAGAGGGTGGGVNMTAGLLVSCIVNNNYDSGDGSGGGGVYMSGGTVRNCLIVKNNSDPVGGGVRMDGGTLESSTIVTNNTGSTSGGGGIYRNGSTAGTVRNCIVFNNTAPNNATYKNSYSGTQGWTYNDTTLPDVPGTGCINAAPLFQDAANGDYRLKACAAVDAGTTLSWMPGALDLAGRSRIVNSVVDMGAYEYTPGALECALAANVTTVLAPANVIFTATVIGSNLASLACTWDFGDGNGTNVSGLAVVTNRYSNPGIYTVKLTVTNGVGELAGDTNANYIAVWATNAYVWTNSPSPAEPYTNWATAARLIGPAAAAAPAGVTIWATNGTYNETAEMIIYKGITVRSVEGNLSGASNTIIRPNAVGYRLVSLNHANAVLQGLTIQDSAGSFNGCGVYMSDGLLRDCIIRNNGFGDNHLGSGVYMIGGTVSNCVVKNNLGGSNVDGSGIYTTGGQILYCQILDNALSGGEGFSMGGGGIYANGAVLMRNCLIARNSAGGTVGNRNGGGVNLVAGTIESCTIVSNSAVGANGGGGVYRGGGTAGTVSNSIVYFNTASASTYSNFYATTDTGIGYTCTTNPVVAGTGCISGDPLFGINYTLRVNSPCIDAGTNEAWMIGAPDLAGNSRKQYGAKAGSAAAPIVDMGCYETFVPPAGTVLMMW